MSEEIIKIYLRGEYVGMIGLLEIFEQAKGKRNLSDVEIEKFLLDEAKGKNYKSVHNCLDTRSRSGRSC